MPTTHWPTESSICNGHQFAVTGPKLNLMTLYVVNLTFDFWILKFSKIHVHVLKNLPTVISYKLKVRYYLLKGVSPVYYTMDLLPNPRMISPLVALKSTIVRYVRRLQHCGY